MCNNDFLLYNSTKLVSLIYDRPETKSGFCIHTLKKVIDISNSHWNGLRANTLNVLGNKLLKIALWFEIDQSKIMSR